MSEPKEETPLVQDLKAYLRTWIDSCQAERKDGSLQCDNCPVYSQTQKCVEAEEAILRLIEKYRGERNDEK